MLRLCKPWPSLGDAKTLVMPWGKEGPRGIPDRFLRVSVGLEDLQDLIADFDQAITLSPQYAPSFNNRAIAYAAKNNARVVISTNTINLQDQLFRKDLPDLEHVLSKPDPAPDLTGLRNLSGLAKSPRHTRWLNRSLAAHSRHLRRGWIASLPTSPVRLLRVQ